VREFDETKPVQLKRMGPETNLSSFTEKEIFKTILSIAETGYLLGRDNILDLVRGYLKLTNQTYLFKNGGPTYSWYYAFLGKINFIKLPHLKHFKK
jgi:hypothetical protein